MRKIFSKLFQLTLLLITFTLLFFFVCFGILQTPFGKHQIEYWLTYTLHSYGVEAKIERLSGVLPFECTLSHMTLSVEKQGTLELSDVSLELSVFSLFKKELYLRTIRSEKVVFQSIEPNITVSFALEGGMVLPFNHAFFEGAFECFKVDSHQTLFKTSLYGALAQDDSLSKLLLKAKIPDLSLLSSDLQGSVKFSSFVEKENGHIEIESSPIEIQGFALGKTYTTVHFTRGTGKGTASFHTEEGTFPITGHVAFGLHASTLVLEDLFVTGSSSELAGNLTCDLSSKMLLGDLYGSTQDLKYLKSLEGDGRIAFHCKLSHQKEEQNAALQLTGDKIRLQMAQVEALTLHADLKNLYGTPYGAYHLTVQHLQGATYQIDTFEMQGERPFNQTAWKLNLNTTGILKEPFEITSSLSLDFTKTKLFLTCKELTGTLLHLPFSLMTPCTLISTEEQLSLSPCLLNVGEGSVQLSFEGSLEKVSSIFEVTHFPLSIVTLLKPNFSLEGSLSATGHLKGEKEHLEGTVQASLEEAHLSHFSEEDLLHAKGTLLATLSEKNIQMQLNLQGDQTQFLEMTASLPLLYHSHPFSLAFDPHQKCSGELTAEGYVQEIFDFVNLGLHHLKGLLSIHLLLSETLSHPFLQGEIDWTEGTYENYLIGTRLSHVNVHMKAEKDQLHVTQIEATDDKEGTLKGTGEVSLNWKEKIPYAFSFDLSQLNTLDFDLIHAKLTGPLSIKGSFTQALAQGNLLVSQGIFHIPDTLPYDIPEIPITYVNRPPTPTTVREKFVFFPFQIDLHLNIPDTVIVEGKGLSSQWKGALHVTGTNLNIGAEGKLKLENGEYFFAGRRFKLTEGEIFFADEKTKTAYIKLQGLLNLPHLEVTAELYGPLSHPQIAFHSNPHMPTSSLLAWILFNKDISDINQFEAVQLATTLVSLSGGAGPDLLDNIRKTLGVDRLSLGPAGKNTEGVAVQIGKYLTKGVMVTLSQSATSTQVIVEVEIGKGFVFQAETQEVEEGKFSLKWRHTY